MAELRVQVFQAALQTAHDIDADSAMGISIVTDDNNLCRFSDDEEVSGWVCMYIIVSEKSMRLCKSR